MHGERDRAEHTRRMMHQPDELPKICLSHQINDATKPWMPMIGFTALDELKLVRESDRRRFGSFVGSTTWP